MQAAKPILYSPVMSEATITERKIQTRREIKPQPSGDFKWSGKHFTHEQGYTLAQKCPYGEVGGLLWVREEHYRFGHWREVPGVKTKTGKQKWAFIPDTKEVLFDAPESFRKGKNSKDPFTPAWHKRLGRFMPRVFSRTMLEITEIRVERLHDITEADAKAEGAMYHDGRGIGHSGWRHDYKDVFPNARGSFCHLWVSINGSESWNRNPWVWVICFKVVK